MLAGLVWIQSTHANDDESMIHRSLFNEQYSGLGWLVGGMGWG